MKRTKPKSKPKSAPKRAPAPPVSPRRPPALLNAPPALGRRCRFVAPGPLEGKACIVAALDGGPGKQIGVQFDEAIPHGHSCDGRAKVGHGWWCLAEELA